MNVNINSARGTVIKVPDATPGILSVGGKQYQFMLERVWKSAIAPSPNQTVTIELDSAGVLTSVTVLDQQQLAMERLSELGGVAQERGKAIVEQIRSGLGGAVSTSMTHRTGAMMLKARPTPRNTNRSARSMRPPRASSPSASARARS